MHTELYNRNVRIFEKEHRGTCTKCNKKIADGETIHLGYDKQYELAYVCDNCSKNLATIIVRHLYKKELYIKPNNKAKLWRFMDLAKYISLIQSKSLFFARADTFEDPFECAKGYKNLEYKWNACYAGFCWGAITSLENLPDIKKTYLEKKGRIHLYVVGMKMNLNQKLCGNYTQIIHHKVLQYKQLMSVFIWL